jgi:hypothetical protein
MTVTPSTESWMRLRWGNEVPEYHAKGGAAAWFELPVPVPRVPGGFGGPGTQISF